MSVNPGKHPPIVRFLARFVLSISVCFVLYHFLFPLYALIILAPAKSLVLMTNENLLQITTRPEISFAGFLFEGVEKVRAIRYDAYFVYMNLVITLALISATPDMALLNRIKKSLWALLIMVGVHCAESFVDLAYAGISASPDPDLIPYSDATRSLLFEVNRFYAHMGLFIIPFLIWFLFCHKEILGLAKGVAKASRSKTVGRNEPCPCGSGKKYKVCCGA